MTSRKPRKTARFNANLWYDEDDGFIHLSFEGTQAAVSSKPASRMGHPALFALLAKVLRDKGFSHPEINEKSAAE